MFSAPPGHLVYQGAGANRIYHSQQVVQSMYDSEYRVPRSGSYMDLYSYPYSYDPYRGAYFFGTLGSRSSVL